MALNGDLAKAGYTLSYRRGYFAENTKHPDYKTGTGTVSTANFMPEHETHNYARDAMTRGAPMPTDILFYSAGAAALSGPGRHAGRWQRARARTPLAPPFRRFDVDVAAMPKYFTLTKQASGNYARAIELAVFVYSPDGKLIKNTTAKKLTLNLTQDAYDKFEKNAVGVHVEVSAPADKNSVLRIGPREMCLPTTLARWEVATASVKEPATAELEQ